MPERAKQVRVILTKRAAVHKVHKFVRKIGACMKQVTILSEFVVVPLNENILEGKRRYSDSQEVSKKNPGIRGWDGEEYK